MEMTPALLKVLLHYYATPTDPQFSPAQAGELLNELLIEPTGNEGSNVQIYRLTDKGDAYVQAVLDTPLPVVVTKWVVPAIAKRDYNAR